MADEHLANWFGLNESKYEWAVREYYWQKRQEEEEEQASETPQSSRPLVQSADLHHGLTDLRNNHFTDSHILPWFQTSYQASLRFCLWAKLTSKAQTCMYITKLAF